MNGDTLTSALQRRTEEFCSWPHICPSQIPSDVDTLLGDQHNLGCTDIRAFTVSKASCPRANYESSEWAYHPAKGPNVSECASVCIAHANCTGFEFLAGSHCTFWRGFACSGPASPAWTQDERLLTYALEDNCAEEARLSNSADSSGEAEAEGAWLLTKWANSLSLPLTVQDGKTIDRGIFVDKDAQDFNLRAVFFTPSSHIATVVDVQFDLSNPLRVEGERTIYQFVPTVDAHFAGWVTVGCVITALQLLYIVCSRRRSVRTSDGENIRNEILEGMDDNISMVLQALMEVVWDHEVKIGHVSEEFKSSPIALAKYATPSPKYAVVAKRRAEAAKQQRNREQSANNAKPKKGLHAMRKVEPSGLRACDAHWARCFVDKD